MDNTIIQLLNQADLRITQVRKDVLTCFLENNHALSSTDIEESMGTALDRITLYRTLKSFEEKGLIHSIVDPNNALKYAMCEATCTEHHHHDEHIHFHCTSCGNTFCIEETIPPVHLPNGYRISNASMIVNGLCSNC